MMPLDRARLRHRQGDLKGAVAGYRRALAQARREEDEVGAALALNSLGTAWLDLREPAKARRALDEALTLARETEDLDEPNELVGAILHNLGNIHLAQGEAGEALARYQEALQIQRECGADPGAALTLSCIADVHQAEGRLEAAVERCSEALDLHRKLRDRRGELADLGQLGELLLLLERHEEARVHLAAAAALGDRLRDPARSAAARMGLGQSLLRLGRVEEALAEWRRVAELTRKLGDRNNEAGVLENLGNVCGSLGRYEEAREHLARAVELREAIGDPSDLQRVRAALAEILYSRRTEGVALLDLGISLHNRMRLEPALDLYHRALAAFREAGDRRREGEVLGLLGRLYSELGIDERARETTEAAIAKLEEELGAVSKTGADREICNLHVTLAELLRRREMWWEALDHLQLALVAARQAQDAELEDDCLMELTRIHQRLENWFEALQRASEAFSLARRLGDPGKEGDHLRVLAHLLRLAGHPDDALSKYRRALELARKTHHRWGEADALWGLGALAFDKRELDVAGEHFAAAIDVLESVRREIASPDLRASQFGVNQELYRNAIRLEFERGDLARAVHLAERRAARTFLELLAESRTEIVQGLDPELRDEERRLLAEQAALERRREALAWRRALTRREEEDPVQEDEDEELQRLDLELEERWRAHQAEIRRRSPRFGDLVEPEILDLATVQRELLDDETVLLAYVLDEPESLLLVVLPGEARAFFLPSGEEIAGMVQELRRAVLEEPGPGLPLPHSFALYQALLAPAADLLGERRLLVMPDGDLHLLPFSLLLSEPAASGVAPGELPYLVRRHAVAYVPSASVAWQLRRRRRAREGPWDRQLLAFGDPLMPAAAAAALLARDRAGSDLDFARPEVARIAALFEDSPDLAAVEAGTLDRFDGRFVSLRLGAEATKEAVESLFDPAARGSVRFVHFATHGWADTGKPQFSWLLLAPGRSGDPLWHTLEIFNARIPAELVVLSACQSGLGRIVQGEGLLGLARAFFYAGATSLCASLWSVDDEATAETMASFYRHLLTDRGDGGGAALAKAEALRRAQLELLEAGERTAHPLFWSPFVLLGDGS